MHLRDPIVGTGVKQPVHMSHWSGFLAAAHSQSEKHDLTGHTHQTAEEEPLFTR